jgi:hypothetical protein
MSFVLFALPVSEDTRSLPPAEVGPVMRAALIAPAAMGCLTHAVTWVFTDNLVENLIPSVRYG